MSKESKAYKNLPKKVYIRTFGCQMNVRDSEFVAGILIDNGFRLAVSVDDADIIIFNSCSVRKHAEERLFNNISALKGLKRKNPDIIIVLMGCTAQAYKDKAISKSPLIDIVCGTGDEADMPGLITRVLEKRCHMVASEKINEKRFEAFPKYREHKFKALVSIGEGCNNFCSYCVVPYVRGRERYRKSDDIVREVRDLAARGFKEITLLGQNVNSYTDEDGKGFIAILEKINGINGIERVRFMTSHPKDAHAELFRAMRDLDKACEHLHLPLQSGSDRVLKLMNRGYSTKKYLQLAEDYRKIVPGGSITTDIIVGFPSERSGDFKKTCNMIKDVGFDGAYLFKYSPREMTKSSKLKDDVADDVKSSRLGVISVIQCGVSEGKNRDYIGREVEVLVEDINKKGEGSLIGRTRTNKPVVFKGTKSMIGNIAAIDIMSVTPYTLRGRMAG